MARVPGHILPGNRNSECSDQTEALRPFEDQAGRQRRGEDLLTCQNLGGEYGYMIPVNFDPPPPPRGDIQQQLSDLRKWADDITRNLRSMAAELDTGSASNN